MIDWAMRSAARLVAPGGRDGRLSILLYHRVLAVADEYNGWDVTAQEFEQQMRVLRERLAPLPLAEALDRLATRSLPPGAVCVTFDDGYADNADVALPILQRTGVPATFFVATGYVDGGRMWNDTVAEAIRHWKDAALDVGWGPIPVTTPADKRAAIGQVLQRWKYLPLAERGARADELARSANVPRHATLMMTSEQIRGLRAAGMDIGAHTVSHPILAGIDDRDATREIVESRRFLTDLLREPVPLFAYPNGKPGRDYGARDVAAVRDAGFRAAVSTAWGVAASDADLFQLPRFTPWDRSPFRFSLRLIANYRNVSPELVPSIGAGARAAGVDA